MDHPPSSKPASPTPIPRGRPLVRRGLLALAVGVLGCADKSGAAQPEGATTAFTEVSMPYPPGESAKPIAPGDAPKSPFLIVPGQVTSPPVPTPIPTPPPVSPPLDAGSPPVPDAGIRVVPPHPPPHPFDNAPHPGPPPHPVEALPPHPGPMPPHPPPPHPLQVAE